MTLTQLIDDMAEDWSGGRGPLSDWILKLNDHIHDERLKLSLIHI